MLFVHACEPEKALEKITRAIELNPLCPDTYWWAAGGANFQLDNYAKAIDCLSRMREQAPPTGCSPPPARCSATASRPRATPP